MIEIIKYQSIDKNSLQAVFSIKMKTELGNLIINKMTLFKKDNQRWISFPSEKYEKEGKIKYFPMNAFEDASTQKNSQEKIIKALDEYVSKLVPQQEKKPSYEQEEIPF